MLAIVNKWMRTLTVSFSLLSGDAGGLVYSWGLFDMYPELPQFSATCCVVGPRFVLFLYFRYQRETKSDTHLGAGNNDDIGHMSRQLVVSLVLRYPNTAINN